MNVLRASLLGGALAVVFALALPAGVSAKGCTAPTSASILWLLDGKVIGEFAENDGREAEAKALGLTFRDSVWRTGLGCHVEIDQETGVVTRRQNALHFITREGASRVAEMYLAEVVRAQEAFRRATGQYATALHYLPAYGLSTHYSLGTGVAFESSVRGWRVEVGFGELGIECHVVQGEVAIPREGLERGVPGCHATVAG